MFNINNYAVFHCKTHKKYIHYIKKESLFNETQCWDCVRDANLSKFKKELKLNNAREQLVEEFSHQWYTVAPGGITAVKIEAGGISVSIESSVEVFNEIPNEYQGYMISKKITGAKQ